MVLLEDGYHYLKTPAQTDAKGGVPFDKYADNDVLQAFLQSAGESCVSK